MSGPHRSVVEFHGQTAAPDSGDPGPTVERELSTSGPGNPPNAHAREDESEEHDTYNNEEGEVEDR